MDDPNQHKMISDDYEGNSPSQNGNEKGYGNQEYMGEYNANNEYYNNYMEEEEDEQEGHLYAQNMSENREGMRREEYPEDESMEDEDSKFITENPNAGQRAGEEEDSAEYMSREGDHILNDDKDEEEDEGDDMGESERYDYGNKDREAEKESESNFGKSVNQANEDEEDQEQREDDEDDDGDMDQIEGKKKIKTEKGDTSVRSQDGDGDKKEGENEEPDSVQRDKGDNEGEEAKQGDEHERKDDEEKKTGEPERRKGGRIPNRLKMLQVQNQGIMPGMTEEDRIFYAIESAKRFNTRILGNRPKLQSYMKQIEKNRVDEKVPIDLLGVPFPSSFVPVYMYDSNGTEYFSMNQAAQIERAPMGKFKRMNIENEGVTLVPEQFNLLKMEPGKRFQRRRKKRPMPIKPAEDSD